MIDFKANYGPDVEINNESNINRKNNSKKRTDKEVKEKGNKRTYAEVSWFKPSSDKNKIVSQASRLELRKRQKINYKEISDSSTDNKLDSSTDKLDSSNILIK